MDLVGLAAADNGGPGKGGARCLHGLQEQEWRALQLADLHQAHILLGGMEGQHEAQQLLHIMDVHPAKGSARVYTHTALVVGRADTCFSIINHHHQRTIWHSHSW